MTDIAENQASASEDILYHLPELSPEEVGATQAQVNAGMKSESSGDQRKTDPKKRGRKNSNRQQASGEGKKKGPSPQLLYSRSLRNDNTYTIEGIAPDGKPSLSLYHWCGSHWQYVYPETAKTHALNWLENHAQNKCDASTADSCVATAVAQMSGTAVSISAREATRGKRVIIPLRNHYIELIDGQWHVLNPDPQLGMTYAVPAGLPPANIYNGIYQPTPVPPESKFGQYLNRFIPLPEDQDRLAEIAAASLIPGGFERMFVFLGAGANGKSTLLHILEAFHPETYTAIRLEHLDRTFGLSSIPGKSLAIATEVPPFIGAEAEQVMKAIVSRDTLHVERKHRDAVSIKPRATLYVAANTPPRLTDHTHGEERKIEYFAFTQTIKNSEIRTGFDRQITGDPAELTAVLDWMLDGAARLVARGGFADPTESQQKLAEQVKVEGDPVYAYLREELVVLPELNAADQHHVVRQWYSSKERIYTAYRDVVMDSGQKPLAAPQFWRQLKARMEARGQELVEVRGTGADRLRLVNIAADPEKAEEARTWLASQQSHREAMARGEIVGDVEVPW